MIFDDILNILLPVICSISLIVFKEYLDRKQSHRENKEIQEDAERIIGDTFNGDDVIDLMLMNVRELREYYIISKRQATKAFSASLIVCVLGFIVYIAGIVVSVLSGENTVLLTTISGTIVEVISGLFFWLYKYAINQLNIYHQRLGTTDEANLT